MQRARDRQRMLAAHGELASDQRLITEVADWSRLESVEGRVLVHREDELTGKRFLMMESTSAKILYIPYTSEMDEIRSRGGLKADSFIRMRRRSAMGLLGVEIEDFGNAEAVLTNRNLLAEKRQELQKQGIEPTEDGWGGWLGKYQRALCATEADRDPADRNEPAKVRQRRRSSLER